ncbi:MAG: hypothetical protein KGR98_08280 [Verrucomicrobia bacterium]|nr:hypothetical protein [Verrucomicrobiota bacterium]MDE3099242.1 hypothetical protein [Verrucomicrobiota bacterium]
MKTLVLVLVAVALLVGASLLFWPRSHGAKIVLSPPPGSKPTKYSDGSSDWYLGSVTTNGTNVVLSKSAIKVVQTTNSTPR